LGEFETVINNTNNYRELHFITIENSPSPSSVYIRPCLHCKKFGIAFIKQLSGEKEQNILFLALINRENLTSHEALYLFLFGKTILSEEKKKKEKDTIFF